MSNTYIVENKYFQQIGMSILINCVFMLVVNVAVEASESVLFLFFSNVITASFISKLAQLVQSP